LSCTREPKRDKEGRREERVRSRYYPTREKTVFSHLEREIKQSDATTLEELITGITPCQDQVTAFLPKPYMEGKWVGDVTWASLKKERTT
jgi:hypothetical protein